MKTRAYLLIFDGLADWEPALALCEINKTGKFEVVMAGLSDKPITTMGGLKLTPEITIQEVSPADTSIFILPGGDMWEQTSHEEVINLLLRLHGEKVAIAAICGATLEIARAGLTRRVRHTSNDKEYLKAMVPGYQDEDYYVDELAVTDGNIITASGVGSVEFAHEVIKRLRIYSEDETRQWFDLFKHGVMPQG